MNLIKNTSQRNETINRIRYACILALFAFIIYYGFILAAAMFYPGGYDFFTNYYSDLGRTVTLNGDNNGISLILFIIGTIMTGLLFTPFWMSYYTIFYQSTYSIALSKVGSAFGMFAIPCLFGIALVPINMLLDLHAIFSFSYYLTITLSLFCYSVANILDPNYPSYSGIIGFSIVIFEILFVIGIFSEIEPLIQEGHYQTARETTRAPGNES